MILVRVTLNHVRPVGFLVIRRTWPTDEPHPDADTVCLYRWEIYNDPEEHGPAEVGDTVAHRYGDPVWTLIARVLADAGHAVNP